VTQAAAAAAASAFWFRAKLLAAKSAMLLLGAVLISRSSNLCEPAISAVRTAVDAPSLPASSNLRPLR